MRGAGGGGEFVTPTPLVALFASILEPACLPGNKSPPTAYPLRCDNATS